MITAKLQRQPTSDDGTFGTFVLDSGWSAKSGELPWRDNKSGISSVAAGTYLCKWQWSASHNQNLYHLQDVPGRSEIEIHVANYCGDRNLGKLCDLRGCITMGRSIGELSGQMAVLGSKVTIQDFHQQMNGQPFELTIYDAS